MSKATFAITIGILSAIANFVAAFLMIFIGGIADDLEKHIDVHDDPTISQEDMNVYKEIFKGT